MNKLIIILSVLCAVSPVVAMELAMITEQENKNFSRHLLFSDLFFNLFSVFYIKTFSP